MRFSSLFILLIIVSCAPIYVNHDYEKGTDFSKYKTYNYYDNINTGLSDFDAKRLFSALDEALQTKGFQMSTSPDFYIDIKSSERQSMKRNSVGVGVGGSGSHVGGGVSVGIPIGQPNIDRKIQFDFVDENGIGLFWQAISESTFKPNDDPESKEMAFKAIVDKVLKKFPPNQ